MIRYFILLLFIGLAFWGCATFVNHPITGEKIAIPPNMENDIDFDLTLDYLIEDQTNINNGKVISELENAGIIFDLTSLNPLLGSSSDEIQLGDLMKEATTFCKLNLKELETGKITFSIVPTYGGAPAGSTQRWILIKSKNILIDRINKILNPLGYRHVQESPLKVTK